MVEDQDLFALNQTCLLIDGAARSAIYDLDGGGVFSIDSRAARLLKGLESGRQVAEVVAEIEDLDETGARGYLDQLVEQQIGSFVEPGHDRTKIEVKPKEPELSFIWLELTEGCNLKCLHCYSESDAGKINQEVMEYEDWARLLEEAREMGCRSLQFIGGEPFIQRDVMLRLGPRALDLGYTFLEVYSNGTLIKDSDLDWLREHGIALALSVYGHEASVHEGVTLGKGSFGRTLRTVRRARELEIPLRIGIIGMSANEATLDETVSYLRDDLGVENVKID